MKTISQISIKIFFVLLMMFLLKPQNVFSQTFPLPGATWVFKSLFLAWVDEYAQKWEYEGDSIVANGVIKKMKVSTKLVNPAWNPSIYLESHQGNAYFLFSGDTVWNLDDTLNPIANFSLQTGDSTFTPYYSSLPFINMQNGHCSYEDSLLVFQKGIVVENGTETEDSFSFKYYKLRFFNENKDTITVKFSERTIITNKYWHYELFHLCGVVVEGNLLYLVCYHDDFITNSNCQDIEWFESLNTSENQLQLGFKIFPNPVKDILNIKTNTLSSIKCSVSVFDFSGKEIYKTEFSNKTDVFQINTANLSKGLYFIEISNDDYKSVKKFVKN